MMRDKIIFGLMLIAVIVAVTEVSAQKYPERRIARNGNKLYEKGDFEAAETEYIRAIEANPELKDARFNLAGALLKQDKAEAAAKIYRGFASDSTETISHTADANFNLGNAMLSGQKIEKAMEFYKQALRLNPEDMQAKYNLEYARKLLQEPPPEDENEDQDQDKDQNDGEGDQDQDKDQNDGEGDQDQDQDKDQNDGEGDQDQDKDQNDGEGDQDQDSEEPQPDSGSDNEMTISAEDAQQMLEIIQDEEDKTREKMNAKEVQAIGRSGKNW